MVRKYACWSFCVFERCCDIESINIFLLGFWYLFLWIVLLKTLDSYANFIDCSFFYVVTLKEMKFFWEQIWEQIDEFLMCIFFAVGLIQQQL